MHHRDVWPIRERLVIGVPLAIAFSVSIVLLLTDHAFASLFTIGWAYLLDEQYEREWQAACKRAGVDPMEAEGW
jgi:hypothetical protein